MGGEKGKMGGKRRGQERRGRGREGRGKKGRKGKGREGKGKAGRCPPNADSWIPPCDILPSLKGARSYVEISLS